jgi:hypothetical protein
MSIQSIVSNAVHGNISIERAAADMLEFAGIYSATTFKYPSAQALGLAVEYRNGMIIGGADAAQYNAEQDMFELIQAAAKRAMPSQPAGDSFTVCNGCA